MKKYLMLFFLSYCLNLLYGNQAPDSLLFIAVKSNDFKQVKELVARGANVNANDSNHATILMWAVYKADLDLIRFLVKNKADYKKKGVIYIDTTKSYYGSIISIAAAENKQEVLKYLVEELLIPVNDREINPKTLQEDGWVAIHWSSEKNNYKITKYLLDHGADVNAIAGTENRSAIIYACKTSNDSLVKLLIEHGSNVNQADIYKNSVLHCYTWSNNLDGCKLLIKAGAHINARNYNGLTPLHVAANNGNLEIVDLLKSSGADTTILDNNGKLYSNYFFWINLINNVNKYLESSNYTRAIYYGEKAKQQAEIEFGKENKNYVYTLNTLGTIYFRLGNSVKAESLCMEAIDISKKFSGTDQIDYYANSLNNLAVIYYDIGNYSKAEPLYIEVLNIRKKVLGTEHPDYATSLYNLAELYVAMNNYSKAEPLFIEALDISKKVFGQESADYAGSLYNLALLYNKRLDYSKAKQLFIESLEIYKKVLPNLNDLYYASSLFNLAISYEGMYNYSKAEPLFIESLNILKNVLGSESPIYASYLDCFAPFYYNIGNYSKVEPIYTEALNIRKKVLGTEHPGYATSLNNLALYYQNIGNYLKAEALFTEALHITKKSSGADSNYLSNYAIILKNLSIFYGELGNSSKEKLLLNEAFSIENKVLKSDNPEYENTLGDVALLNSLEGNYSVAEQLFTEALNLKKKVMGTEHPDYAVSLGGLANLYLQMRNYSKAESLLIESINIYKKNLGTEGSQYALCIRNLGALYYKIGNYLKAEPLYIEALNIQNKLHRPEYPFKVMYLDDLAALNVALGNYSQAEPFYMQINDNLNNQIEKKFSFLSEKEKEKFLNKNIDYYFDELNSFILKRKESNISVPAVSYNNELAHKGMLLQNTTALRQAVYNKGDSLLINTYEHFIGVHKVLSQLYTLPIAQQKENTDSLENIANKLEKELIEKGKNLPGVDNLTGLTKIKWQDVQHSIKPNEAAIEFVNFHYFDKRWTDSTFYCALVLCKGYKYPKMVYLFEEKQLQKYVSVSKATDNSGYISSLYSYNSDLSSKDTLPFSQNILYNLVWHPLDSLLKGVNTLYLAPSGLLHKVAFDAIPVAKDTFLSDKYNIHILSSTRLLTQSNKAMASISGNYSATLYGGIEYDMDSTEMLSLARSYQKNSSNYSTSRSFNIPENKRGYAWMYLPGTYTEVDNIQKIFKSKQINTRLFTGKAATEESFKHLTDNGKSPEIIHLATHGFFFPEVKIKKDDMNKIISRGETFDKPSFTSSENPLLRSGILLAGASRAWDNLEMPPSVEDGTLTAYEISNMNLSNTKLVVLSACETGLGDIKGSEGVYGLQRAFKMAGVQYLIISLWQVPDEETSELMQLFYKNCLGGMTIKEGFRAAQQTLRKKYDPYHWAAFVLIE